MTDKKGHTMKQDRAKLRHAVASAGSGSGGDRGGSKEPTQAYSKVRRGERRSDNEDIRTKTNRHGPKPEIMLNIWLQTKEGLVFGVGRAELLDKIEACGSLRKAAEEMCMSYRAAWGKIKKTEEVLGFKLIEKEKGNKTGFRLTEAGRVLKTNYREWYRAVETEALRKARKLFPWTMTTGGKKATTHRVSEQDHRKC